MERRLTKEEKRKKRIVASDCFALKKQFNGFI